MERRGAILLGNAESSRSHALAAGTRLGHFEVIAPVGSGGMGEVYRARDLDLRRDVALKVLPGEFAQDRDAWPDSSGSPRRCRIESPEHPGGL